MKRKPADNQTLLLLSRPERLAALKSIDREALGLSRTIWGGLVDLLTQIEVCTGPGGCYAYGDTLAGRMNTGVGVSDSTYRRAVGLAKSLGLVAVETRRTAHGQRSNGWAVDWARISQLAHLAGWRAPNEKRAKPQKKPDCQNDTPPCQNASLYKRNSLSVVQTDESTAEPSRDGLTAEAASEVQAQAVRVVRQVGRVHRPQDWALATKAVRLSLDRYGEAWLWESADVASKARNPWAYFYTVLADRTRRLGDRLPVELARLQTPPELERPPAASDLTERSVPAGSY